MGIRDILVHLDNSAASSARLDTAVAYASKHGARLRGLYLITHMFYEPRALGEQADSDKVEQMFITKTTEANIIAEWMFQDCTIMGSNVSDIITRYAYFTDLIVLGQANISSPVSKIPTDLVERVILSSGRPVLVIPYSGVFKTAGDRIMVAWKAGRESIRAINDALPFLQKAHSVVAVEGIAAGENSNDTLISVEDFLRQHDITVSLDTIISGNFPIGDMILNTICENKIDLLVMGAFAPNRRGNLELSPIARHILKHLTAPVIMSH
jgi:nucleotide-binding universal stress UspA family protein